MCSIFTIVSQLPLLVIQHNIVCSLQIFKYETQGGTTPMHLISIITRIEIQLWELQSVGRCHSPSLLPLEQHFATDFKTTFTTSLDPYHIRLYFLPCGARDPSCPDVISIGEQTGP
jgi:hypothetical protein